MTTTTAIAHGLWVSILGRHQSPSSVFASCHVAFIIYQFMLQKHTPKWGASQPHSPPKNGHDCRRRVDRARYYRVAHCAHYTLYSFVLLLGTLAANFTATRGDEVVRASEMFSPVLSRRFDYLCRLKRKSYRGVKGMPTVVAERNRV